MAERTAKIKIALASGAFTNEIKKTEAQVKASGKRMGKSVGKELDSGFKRGQKALTSMGKSMGRMIKQVGTIGTAFATGALLKDAVEIHKSFNDISFMVSKIPGQQMKVAEVQDLVTGAANRTTRTTKEMAAAFTQVYKATGDLNYAKESLDMIGKAATATGAPIEQIAQVAEMVRRKWGVTGKEADDMLAKFIEKADKGGLSLDGLSSRLDMVAGVAASMGVDATELLGTIQQLDATMGAMAPRGLKTLLEYMREGTTQAEQLEKAGKFKFAPDADALDRIRMIIEDPKSHKMAMKVFTETSRTAFDELRKPFVETLEASRKAGDDEEVAQAKALMAYDEMVKQIRHTEMSAADIDRLYKNRKDSDPSVKMRQALNKIRDAFAQPKMINAITKLADKLPALAKVVADFVGFLVDNPLGAMGVGMGLRIGMPMAMGGLQNRMGGGGWTGGAGFGGGGGVGAAAAGAKGPVKGLGRNALGAAGQIAGMGALAYTAGKSIEALIDAESEAIDAWQQMRFEMSETYARGIGAASTEEGLKVKEQSIKDVQQSRKKAGREGVGGVELAGIVAGQLFGGRKLGDWSSEASKTVGQSMGEEKKLKLDKAKSTVELYMTYIEKQLTIDKKNAKTKEDLVAAEDKAASNMEKLMKKWERVAASTGKIGLDAGVTPGGGSRGTKDGLSTDPGSEPKKKKG